jgi:succinoglycan biosynthesis transport protein ExoP
METTDMTVSDYVAMFRRRSLLFASTVFFIVLAAIAVAFVLPATYYASGTILIEQQDVPEDLVRSTVSNYAAERLQVVTQRVMTTVNLAKIIEEHDLYPDERAGGMSSEAAVELFRADTTMEPLSAEVASPGGRTITTTIAFMVGYTAPTAAKAQTIAKALADLYLMENALNRKEAASGTTTFLSRQADALKAQLAEKEAELASFKATNGESLPEMQRLNLDRLESTESEIADLQQEIRGLRDNRDLQSSELAVMSPYAAYESADGNIVATDPRRLDQLQRDYIALSAKYGPSHPDLIRLRREIELLTGSSIVADLTPVEEQLFSLRQRLDAASQNYGADHPEVTGLQRQIASLEARRADILKSSARDVAPTNPLYIQKQGQLNATTNQLATAESRLATLNQRLNDLEQRLQVSPEVERQFVGLTREHEAMLTQYRELQGKLETALLAETLEVEQRGERFRLTNPPLLPTEPASPNRIAIILLGFVLALGAGIGLVVLIESLDDTVRSPKDVARIFQMEPITSIGYMEGPRDVRKRRARNALIGGVAVASVAVVTVIIQAAG